LRQAVISDLLENHLRAVRHSFIKNEVGELCKIILNHSWFHFIQRISFLPPFMHFFLVENQCVISKMGRCKINLKLHLYVLKLKFLGQYPFFNLFQDSPK
jgi:hypothetical protein